MRGATTVNELQRAAVDGARLKFPLLFAFDVIMRPEFRTAAREIAARSMVLLKNAGGVLPLSPAIGRLAVIGPLADDRVNMMGNWTGDGRAQDVVTVLEGIRAAVSPQTRVLHARGTSLDVKTLAAAGRAASEQPAAARHLSPDSGTGSDLLQPYPHRPATQREREVHVEVPRGFQRVSLRPGERRRVTFSLTREHLGFYNRDMMWVVEPGEFTIRVSNSSVGGLTTRLEVR